MSGRAEQQLLVRPALKVGAVNDPAEHEADAVADMVMSMPAGPDHRPADGAASPSAQPVGAPTIRRDCGCGCGGGGGCGGSDELRRQADEEEEEVQLAPAGDTVRRQDDDQRDEELQMKPAAEPRGRTALDGGADRRIEATRGGGSPLSSDLRRFFEPRFGADLSSVRVHADQGAATMAASVSARAFTVGRDVYFGAGEYHPGSPGGRHLIAHELTHTLQSNESTVGAVRRRVRRPGSSCPANVHNAPADPLTAIAAHDADAERMALGASNVLFVEALIRDDPTFGPSDVSRAYLDRFGHPTRQANGRFRTAFTGNRNFATEAAAISAGMNALADRFSRVARLFAGRVEYDCTGFTHTTIGGCTHHCGPNDGAASCSGGGRHIALCPLYWNNASANDQQRAGMLVHEAIHILFGHRNHNFGSPAQRRANPECYTSFLADIYNFTTWDPKCPR